MNVNGHQVPQLQLLGPSGVQERIRQIQGKLASVGVSKSSDFDDLIKAPTSELSGEIGGTGSLTPFDPMSNGVRLVPPKAPEEIKELIGKVALEAGVDPHLLDALVAAESGYDPTAKSPVGAMGLTQLMRGTAQEMG
ncbi:MAG TPA: transglycosylase SLT domain-containing protein, partial [Fimbriimonadaceae bacterium]|nr:transglycosylase SLT domain-containing protein [Fimbriimonadaceae bacterium]